MTKKRDEFREPIKRKLADRVAWKCSFLDCDKITIGPGHKTNEQVVKLGNAAHITAASDKGPRFDSSLTPDQRKAIDNGIWMCCDHATLIDKDFTIYSAATLRQWKKIKEENTYKLLKNLTNKELSIPNTLVSIGQSLIFEGVWKSVEQDIWKFEIDSFVIGDSNDLIELSTKNYDNINDFVIIESQGDGRVLSGKINWEKNYDKYQISLKVSEKSKRINPDSLCDIGFDPTVREVVIEDGDFKVVKGIECAKQQIAICLSLGIGDLLNVPQVYSYFSEYFWKFQNNQAYLNRLLKLEITRLVSIPIMDFHTKEALPPLNFINRIIDAQILDMKMDNQLIPIRLKLEWGNGKIWEDDLKILIRPEMKKN